MSKYVANLALTYFSVMLVLVAFSKSGLVRMKLVSLPPPLIPAILHRLTKTLSLQAKYLSNLLLLIHQFASWQTGSVPMVSLANISNTWDKNDM
jgi:hypothetical protein